MTNDKSKTAEAYRKAIAHTKVMWTGWVLRSAQPEWLHTIDAILENPQRYGARLHAGHVGEKARCGVRIPVDDPDRIMFFVTEQDAKVPRCQRCERKVQNQ